MALDPNWFYSSLAQSTASIVGLSGAILATQLQAQIRTAREKRIDLANAVIRWHGEVSGAMEQLDDFLAVAEEQLTKVRVAIAAGSGVLEVDRWRTITSSSSGRKVMLGIAAELADQEQQFDGAKLLNPLLARLAVSENFTEFLDRKQALEGATSRLKGVAGQFAWDQIVSAQRVADGLKRVSIAANAPMEIVLFLVFVALAVLGIVIPLGKLAAFPGAGKPALLGAFVLCLTFLFAYVGVQLTTLKRLGSPTSVRAIRAET